MSYHRTGRFGQFDLRTGGAVQFTPTEVSSREAPMPTGTQQYSAGVREMQLLIDEAAFQQASSRESIPQQTDPVSLPARQPVEMETVVTSPYEPIVTAPRVPTPTIPAQENPAYQPSAQIVTRGTPVIAPMATAQIVGTSTPTAQPSGLICGPGMKVIVGRSGYACVPEWAEGAQQIDQAPGPTVVPDPCPSGAKWVLDKATGENKCVAHTIPLTIPITTEAPPPTGPITTPDPCPSGAKWVLDKATGENKCVAHTIPLTIPITTEAPPPTGPITTPDPTVPVPLQLQALQLLQQQCAASAGALDAQGCCRSSKGNFTIDAQGVVRLCADAAVQDAAAGTQKSPVVPIAIAAGAVLLLTRLL